MHAAAGRAGALGLTLFTVLAPAAVAQSDDPRARSPAFADPATPGVTDGPQGQILQIPGLPPIRITPGGHVVGPSGPIAPNEARRDPRNAQKQAAVPAPKLSPEERAAAIKKALEAKPTPAVVRAQALDVLFKRLAAASDSDEAKGIAATIEHIWLRTDSDTAELLMERALTAMAAKQYPVATSLLDKVIALQPGWGEPWNKRATVRYLTGDIDGSMADVGEVLKREPRHFGALVGMGLLLQHVGLDKQALDVLRRALAIYPSQPDVAKLVDKLSLEVEGRDL
jgi:tetratricopeptide (TPR) repeat protein